MQSSSVYLGETARSLYTRWREHVKNCDKKYTESCMNSHQNDQYAGVMAYFNAKVMTSYRDCQGCIHQKKQAEGPEK